jgi:hypothetical protein
MCIFVSACVLVLWTITDSTKLSSGVLTCRKSCGDSESAPHGNMIIRDVIIITANLGVETEHETAHIT